MGTRLLDTGRWGRRTFATGELIQGLRDLGYVEGRNIIIEWRWGHGTTERFSKYAADVVRLNVDVIVASNAAADTRPGWRPRLSPS